MQTTTPLLPGRQSNPQPIPGTPPSVAHPHAEFDVPDELVREISAEPPSVSPPDVQTVATPSRPSPWQRIAIGLLSLLILVSLAGVAGYLSGARVSASAVSAGNEKTNAEKKNALPVKAKGVSLVEGKPHALAVPEDVRAVLGMRKGNRDLIALAKVPTEMRPLVFPGSTALDPIRLARVRARFAPARVVQIGQIHDYSPKDGKYEVRELRPGDRVTKGQVLGIFYSVDVGSKKNDLLDALTQLELDQKILDNAEKHLDAVPEVFLITAQRAVQTDRNQVNRALHNLEAWDIPQDEIDALHEEAKKQAADKNAWKKTREGRWVTGAKTKPTADDKIDPDKLGRESLGQGDLAGPVRRRHRRTQRPRGRDGRRQHGQSLSDRRGEQAPGHRQLPRRPIARRWKPWTASSGDGPSRPPARTRPTGLPGTIDEIGYLIDPNQHTAVIKGYVDNPGERLRAGQYVTATVPIPPPAGVVEIPIERPGG